MEVLLELLLEVILTPILTAYADLAETVFGGRKLGKRLEYFLRILCGIVFTVALLLVLAGILVLSDEEAEGAGKGMLIVGGCILLVHVLIGIVAKICRPSEKEEGNGEEGEEEAELPEEETEEQAPQPLVYRMTPEEEKAESFASFVRAEKEKGERTGKTEKNGIIRTDRTALNKRIKTEGTKGWARRTARPRFSEREKWENVPPAGVCLLAVGFVKTGFLIPSVTS